MCGYMAPAVVSLPEDLIEYYVSDGSTVDPNAKKGYSERFIHGEMFKKFPEVNCVIHSHAEAVLPYVTSGVPLLPVFHMAGFLGKLCNPVVSVLWAEEAADTSRYTIFPRF
jgi:ribulose-5-phosphate 4-epimerase/fuculose-1-phosphate aldolase